jgi:hypothetical protein
MTSHCRELDLKAMLADPIVKAVIQADGIDPRELEAELMQIAALLRGHGTRQNRVWRLQVEMR